MFIVPKNFGLVRLEFIDLKNNGVRLNCPSNVGYNIEMYTHFGVVNIADKTFGSYTTMRRYNTYDIGLARSNKWSFDGDIKQIVGKKDVKNVFSS